MLSDYTPTPSLAVADLARAREFYEGVLGLTAAGDGPEGVRYPAGAGALFVYPSAYAGTNKATAAAFEVPLAAFDVEVAALRAQGVELLTFDLEGIVWADGVATMPEMGGAKAVWFADPDGNILNIGTPMTSGSA